MPHAPAACRGWRTPRREADKQSRNLGCHSTDPHGSDWPPVPGFGRSPELCSPGRTQEVIGCWAVRYCCNVPFPVSRKRVDSLGQQLAAEGAVGDEHRSLFFQILEHYQQLLDNVAEEISRIGYEPTTRVKTTGTLIEKLKREHGIKLSRIQDVAGARIVIGRLRTEQDRVVAEICRLFEGLPRSPVVIDRRADPRHGYRAVHVIVYPEGIPVEVQIRTTLQDMWAQVFEGLADQWGRQIRYGDVPELPEAVVVEGDSNDQDEVTRADILKLVQSLADRIDRYEESIANMMRFEPVFAQAAGNPREIPRVKILAHKLEKIGSTPENLAELKDAYTYVRRFYIKLLLLSEPDKRRRCRLIRRNYPQCAELTFLDFERAAAYAFSRYRDVVIDARSRMIRQEDHIRGILSDLARTISGVT